MSKAKKAILAHRAHKDRKAQKVPQVIKVCRENPGCPEPMGVMGAMVKTVTQVCLDCRALMVRRAPKGREVLLGLRARKVIPDLPG